MAVEVFTPSKSTFIAQLEFDDSADRLLITFTDGTSFAYRGVTKSTYRNFTLAPSPGSFFHRHIKDAYPYEEA